MKAKQVIDNFISESGMQDPEEILGVLCDWFDEHDETESLNEYLVYVMEGKSREQDTTYPVLAGGAGFHGSKPQRAARADPGRNGAARLSGRTLAEVFADEDAATKGVDRKLVQRTGDTPDGRTGKVRR